MKRQIHIALGQINPIVGDFAGNIDKMSAFCQQALDNKVQLLIFPELAICGYPPEDLLYKKHFLKENRTAVELLAKKYPDITIITGFAEQAGSDCYNSAAVMRNGKVEQIYRKVKLPNYSVFDEKRYFKPGSTPVIIDVADLKIAVTICEDIWQADWLKSFLDSSSIDAIVNLSGSPFHIDKFQQRQAVLSGCAKALNCPVAYCNQVGGQDELVFDGRSMIVNSKGNIDVIGPAFKEALIIAEITETDKGSLASGGFQIKPVADGDNKIPSTDNTIDDIYQGLTVGLRDYVRKNGFKKVLIGLSGGIDSALVAAIAVNALGRENVTGITMPSRFNKDETISDAQRLAENLDIQFYTIPIEQILASFDQMLTVIPEWNTEEMGYENLQPRIRGTILMTISNQTKAMVLTTGNKSETAVGYCTLYGDTAGGFAVIKDLPKTMVYQLCRYINKVNGYDIIPVSIIDRAPSAELRENQLDSDSLGDYDLLDKITKGYVEQDKSPAQLIEEGLDPDYVKKIIRMIDLNEYKRRQSPPGIKITPKAFGRDRRLPITNKYRA